MKKKLSILPALVLGVILAFTSPGAALAQSRGGGHSGGFSRGGRSYSGGARGFSGGVARPSYGGNAYRGREYDRGYYRGGRYYGGGYYGGGLALGFGVPYAYGPYGYGYGYAPAPAPCGYYDSWGRWHADPYCYSGSAGY